MVIRHTTEGNTANRDHAHQDTLFREFQRSRKRIRHATVTIAAALAFVFAATAPEIETSPSEARSAARFDAVGDFDDSTGRALDTFWQFAVNALVLPLVDDTDPPRWSDYMIDWICDGRGQVTIDGRPLPDGEPVPAGPFRVRWDLQRCAPFAGAELLLDGVIELAVSRDSTGLSAQIIAPVSGETSAGRFRFPSVAAESRTKVAQ